MKREDMALMNWLKTGIKPMSENVKELRFMNNGTMFVFHVMPNKNTNELYGTDWMTEDFISDILAGGGSTWDLIGTWIVSPYLGWQSSTYTKEHAFEVIAQFLRW